MQVINEPGQRVPIKAWIDGVELEDEARTQLVNVAKMPFIFKHVAVMPDAHAGVGCTVGSVIAATGAIMPACVGVDIGCGMVAYKTSLRAEDLPDDLSSLRSDIERAVPHGRTDNGGKNDRGAWGEIPKATEEDPDVVRLIRDFDNSILAFCGDKFSSRWDHRAILRQLGTLGGGNHFIEECLDEQDNVWVMLHSGSRGVGNAIGTTFIERAKKQAKSYFIPLPDSNLAYFPEGTREFNEYVNSVGWAQDYAKLNRVHMLESVLKVLERNVGKSVRLEGGEAVNCHHNYIARESHFGQNIIVTRKGAVRAREGDMGIIPGSMGAKSFIVRGKGNADSFTSCSHGAGRRMSRTKAKATITLDDHAKATAGVECRKDAEVLDESPAAYKSIDAVMAAQSDLVEVVHTLKAICCVKG
jgi:tRNA-splicing ligase RtcB